MSKINQAVATALERIELCKQRITALHFALGKHRSQSAMTGEAEREFSALHACVLQYLNMDHAMPGSWLESEEKEFLKEIQDAAQP